MEYLIGAASHIDCNSTEQIDKWDSYNQSRQDMSSVYDQTSFVACESKEEGHQNSLMLTNSENESNDSDDQKPKKKTRRGGKRARQQRAKKVAASIQNAEEPAPALKEPKEQIKYKTELCKNWIEKGKCSYSVRCKFAHGYHELVQNKAEERLQQTAKCETFHTEGYCSYGTRCIYQHETRSVQEINESYFGKNITFLAHELADLTVVRKRLPIFQEIAPIAKLSIFSAANVFLAKRFCAQGSFEVAPNENSYNYASDPSEAILKSYERMNTYCRDRPSFIDPNMTLKMGGQGVTTLKTFESLQQCTNFKNFLQTKFDAQQLVSGYTK